MNHAIWHDDKAMADNLSFWALSQPYKIMYNSRVDNTFYVHGENTIWFPRSKVGLYLYKLNDGLIKESKKK